MATINIIRARECASQNHFHLSFSGDFVHEYDGGMDDLKEPITDEEKDIFVKVLVRITKMGRTASQLRTALANGYTITI